MGYGVLLVVTGVVFTVIGVIQLPASRRRKEKNALLIAGAATLAVGLVYTGLAQVQQVVEESKYATYSNFGFSFRYPKELPVVEGGLNSDVPDRRSGYIGTVRSQLLPAEGQQQFIEGVAITWEMMEEAPEIGGVLSEYLRQSNAQGGLAYGGISVSGYRAEAQSYTVPGLRSGVVGVWYCRRNMTLYRLDYVRLGQSTLDAFTWSMSEGQKEHKRYMESFRCLSESEI